MVLEALKELFRRDLEKLKQEIQLYQSDTRLWAVEKSIHNSGGNLCLHLIGNLKTFIGNGLGQIGYVRQREREFSAKFVDRTEMLTEVDETIEIVDAALSQLDEARLQGPYPMKIWAEETGMLFTLMHLYGHLTYHLGQINYHRRLLDAD